MSSTGDTSGILDVGAVDGNEWLVTFHQSLIFPVSRWVRSVPNGLAEGVDCVPRGIKAELLHTFGISGTDLIENSFDWLREKARRDKAEGQSPMAQWQRTMASPFMDAYVKRPLQLSAESETLTPAQTSSTRESANAAWGQPTFPLPRALRRRRLAASVATGFSLDA